MIDKGQCKICEQWFKLDDKGKLPPHTVIDKVEQDKYGNWIMGPRPCRGVNPKQPKLSEYTVSFDHHPRDYYGGGWEQNRRKH